MILKRGEIPFFCVWILHICSAICPLKINQNFNSDLVDSLIHDDTH